MQNANTTFAVPQPVDETVDLDLLTPDMLEMIAGGEATVNAI